jgi:hypothetical protein
MACHLTESISIRSLLGIIFLEEIPAFFLLRTCLKAGHEIPRLYLIQPIYSLTPDQTRFFQFAPVRVFRLFNLTRDKTSPARRISTLRCTERGGAGEHWAAETPVAHGLVQCTYKIIHWRTDHPILVNLLGNLKLRRTKEDIFFNHILMETPFDTWI